MKTKKIKIAKKFLVLGLIVVYMSMAVACNRNDNNNPSGEMAGNTTRPETGTTNANTGNNTDSTNNTNGTNSTNSTNSTTDTTNGTTNGTDGSLLDDAGNAVGDIVEDAADGVADITNDLVGNGQNTN